MQSLLLRDANVRVDAVNGFNRRGHPHVQAHAVIDGQFEHTFPAESRVSKSLSVMSPEQLSDRLSGGHFFFVDQQLIDFRDGNYEGFVHTDDALEQLIELIGITNTKRFGVGARLLKGNTHAGNIMLGKLWSKTDIVVPGYQTGGTFDSQLIFTWNPFVHTVNTIFNLVRQICTNGMVGITSFLNTRVPIINRWEEHLEIANRQIQHKVHAMATTRFAQMATERATVGEIYQVMGHALARHKTAVDGGRNTEAAQLRNIITILDPKTHLAKTYRESVFSDARVAAQLPGHLTTFDTYNMATEVRSHSTENEKSTPLALDRFANRILFDRENLTGHVGKFEAPPISQFSDSEQAFFGLVH